MTPPPCDARHTPRQRPERGSIRALGLTVLVVAMFLGVASIAALAFSVSIVGASMTPTLKNGDRIVPNVRAAGADAQRFSIVESEVGDERERVAKRIIGLPGDTVAIDAGSDGMHVYLKPSGSQGWQVVENPTWQTAKEVTGCCSDNGQARTFAPVVVPAGSVWVLGDNLDGSSDSRKFGFITQDRVRATLSFRFLPLSGFGAIPNEVTTRPVADSELPTALRRTT